MQRRRREMGGGLRKTGAQKRSNKQQRSYKESQAKASEKKGGKKSTKKGPKRSPEDTVRALADAYECVNGFKVDVGKRSGKKKEMRRG